MFCKFCGEKLSDDSIFCNKCGKTVNENQKNNTTSLSTKHKVTIFRESQMYLINPPVNIAINNIKKQSIANGETIELDMDEGNYSFIFSASFLRKRKVDIFLDRDILITLKWDRITGALKADVS